MTWVFVAFAGIAAIDWWAVHTGRRQVEVIAKPLTLSLLIVVATDTQPEDIRVWLLVALALSLVGDVLLLGASSSSFVGGLSAFLLGHVAYIAAFVIDGVDVRAFIGVILVVVSLGALAPRILAGVQTREPALRLPVLAYIGVISAMVIAAAGTGRWLALAGAALFYSSDAAIAWTRFVADHRFGRLFVMTTYHVGQALIVAAYL